jgi:ATPase subunit of ABC transporter with duplicated ATPase domains
MYVGNYEFWYESSQLLLQQKKDENKKAEEKAKELREFIARFSANKSKAKQATSRKKLLDKLDLTKVEPSTRKYPFVGFKQFREVGNDILEVNGLTKKGLFENLSFTVNKNDKIAFLSENSMVITTLFNILSGKEEADSGTFKWGVTTRQSYLMQDNKELFADPKMDLINWLRQYSPEDETESFLRSWLGRVLFTGEEAKKLVHVMSGGEKIRANLAKIMLEQGNVLVLEDPTNHLDLESISALNDGMTAFKGNILFSSHDAEMLNTVANRLIVIDNEKKVFDKEITYEEYMESKLGE